MKRREFLKRAGLATAGAAAAPYILPSGRLFAASGNQIAEHVIFVLFAGGVKQQEAVLQEYISTTQFPYTNHPPDNQIGNVMYNMMKPLNNWTGEDGQIGSPEGKIIYGLDNSTGTITPVLKQNGNWLGGGKSLEEGSLYFPEMTALSAGHYTGLNQLLQGSTAASQGLKQKPTNPTIFEYARKYNGYDASKVWFVGNTLGNSVPLLNYSLHPDFGPEYGANMFIPNTTFGSIGEDYFSDAKIYHPEDQLDPIYEMKAFLDHSFQNADANLEVVGNSADEKQHIKKFMNEIYGNNGNFSFPPITSNGDISTMAYTAELINEFRPNLVAVTMSGVDGCHSNYSGYLSNLHKADYAVGYIWDLLASGQFSGGTDLMGNPKKDMNLSNTAIVIAPECGRNLVPNPIKDDNNWLAYDHSGETPETGVNPWNGTDRYNTRRVFGMVSYPGVNPEKIGDITTPIGQTTDCMLTVADLLGFKQPVKDAAYIEGYTESLLDR